MTYDINLGKLTARNVFSGEVFAMVDYYKILQLQPKATDEDIKKVCDADIQCYFLKSHINFSASFQCKLVFQTVNVVDLLKIPQCCGSGMFIPDPDFFLFRIRQ